MCLKIISERNLYEIISNCGKAFCCKRYCQGSSFQPEGKYGCLEGKDYVVTWALGHLVTLADPEEYDKKYMKWKMNTLPMMPDDMKLVVYSARQVNKYNAVKTQLFRKDIGDIIIATDAGREGELVARWILG